MQNEKVATIEFGCQSESFQETGERKETNTTHNMRLSHNPSEEVKISSTMCCSSKQQSKSAFPVREAFLHRRRRPSKDESVETFPLGESSRSLASDELSQSSFPRHSSITESLEHSFCSDNSKKVTFGEVQIHSHQFILGDNPSVSSGPPVTMNWKSFESGTFDLDEYEKQKPAPRSKEAMILPRSFREELLREEGFSRGEMKIATEEATRIQQQRLKSSKDGKVIRQVGKCLKRLKRGSLSRGMDEMMDE